MNNRIKTVFFVLFVFLVSSLGIFLGVKSLKKESNAKEVVGNPVTSFVSETKIENNENESDATKEAEKNKKETGKDNSEIYDEIHKLLMKDDSKYADYLAVNKISISKIVNYLAVGDMRDGIDEFEKWLKKSYDSRTVQLIFDTMKKKDITQEAIYRLTGKTFMVLLDEYMEKNDGRLKENNNNYANLLFAGDLCLEENGFVLDKYKETNDIYSCISPDLIEKMNKSDVFMLNHEYAISSRGEPLKGKYYTFRANEERMDILGKFGTDIVSLANNHVYDYGYDAFEDTINNLDKASISHVGGGMNMEEAAKPVYFYVNGIKIGYVAACRAEKYRFTPEATGNSPGIVLMYELDKIKKIIENTRRNCDYLIAYIHWGTEDSNYYEDYQIDIAKELIASGTDIIIGGHPHVLQGMEFVDDKPVIYSMGDFWFNSEKKYTGMLELIVDSAGLKSMNWIAGLQNELKTVSLDEENSKEAYKFINNLSKSMYIDENGAIKKLTK